MAKAAAHDSGSGPPGLHPLVAEAAAHASGSGPPGLHPPVAEAAGNASGSGPTGLHPNVAKATGNDSGSGPTGVPTAATKTATESGSGSESARKINPNVPPGLFLGSGLTPRGKEISESVATPSFVRLRSGRRIRDRDQDSSSGDEGYYTSQEN